MKLPTRPEIVRCLRDVRYPSKRGGMRALQDHHIEAVADAIVKLIVGEVPAGATPEAQSSGSLRFDGDPPYCDGCKKSARASRIVLWRVPVGGGSRCAECFEAHAGRPPQVGRDLQSWPSVFVG